MSSNTPQSSTATKNSKRHTHDKRSASKQPPQNPEGDVAPSSVSQFTSPLNTSSTSMGVSKNKPLPFPSATKPAKAFHNASQAGTSTAIASTSERNDKDISHQLPPDIQNNILISVLAKDQSTTNTSSNSPSEGGIAMKLDRLSEEVIRLDREFRNMPIGSSVESLSVSDTALHERWHHIHKMFRSFIGQTRAMATEILAWNEDFVSNMVPLLQGSSVTYEEKLSELQSFIMMISPKSLSSSDISNDVREILKQISGVAEAVAKPPPTTETSLTPRTRKIPGLSRVMGLLPGSTTPSRPDLLRDSLSRLSTDVEAVLDRFGIYNRDLREELQSSAEILRSQVKANPGITKEIFSSEKYIGINEALWHYATKTDRATYVSVHELSKNAAQE